MIDSKEKFEVIKTHIVDKIISTSKDLNCGTSLLEERINKLRNLIKDLEDEMNLLTAPKQG